LAFSNEILADTNPLPIIFSDESTIEQNLDMGAFGAAGGKLGM
jgi:hypothetical protein